MRSVLKRLDFTLWSAKTFWSIAVVLLVGVLPAYIFIGFQPTLAASSYSHDKRLDIPQLQIHSAVEELTLDHNQLKTPDTTVGSYQQAQNTTLLIGHSSTIFHNLSQAQIGQTIRYGGTSYQISSISILTKTSIDMHKLLDSNEKPTLILMTCAGKHLGNQDYSHRLVITATRE